MTDKTLPPGWETLGELPMTLNEREALVEDIFQIRSQSGEFTIDVGWRPALDIAGQFYCQVIERDNWEFPLEDLTTRDLSAVRRWLAGALELYAARLAFPDEMGEAVNVLEQPSRPIAMPAEPTVDMTSIQSLSLFEPVRDAA